MFVGVLSPVKIAHVLYVFLRCVCLMNALLIATTLRSYVGRILSKRLVSDLITEATHNTFSNYLTTQIPFMSC